jgi:hypothetical protein
MSQPFISGITIVRNAAVLDYPFRESVLSLLPLCDELIINCGDSTDNTRAICADLEKLSDKIRVIESVWDVENQSGGFQLKAQTDRAIREAKGNWCFYLQADEVLHEADTMAIKEAIIRANLRPEIDGILFDYVHFYGSHFYTIRGRNWYRREVRVFKTGRSIEAFRDAQGFRKNGQRLKAIASKARVFHYGYVRNPSSFQKKSAEMAKWWGSGDNAGDFKLYRHIGLERFSGTAPAVMRSRIEAAGDFFRPKMLPRKWDKREIKNALTFLWEKFVPYRIAEFRNYDLVR